MANFTKIFGNEFESQELMLNPFLKGTHNENEMAKHALKFTQDLRVRCKNIVDSDKPNWQNILKVFLEYNQYLKEIQTELADQLNDEYLKVPVDDTDYTPIMMNVLSKPERELKGFVDHGIYKASPELSELSELIKVMAQDELTFIESLKEKFEEPSPSNLFDLIKNLKKFADLNLEFVKRLIYAFKLREFKSGGRSGRSGRKRSGKKRTGVSGKKRGRRTNKKRKSITRRK